MVLLPSYVPFHSLCLIEAENAEGHTTCYSARYRPNIYVKLACAYPFVDIELKFLSITNDFQHFLKTVRNH